LNASLDPFVPYREELAQRIRDWRPDAAADLSRSAADARWGQVALIEEFLTLASTPEVLALINEGAIPKIHTFYGSIVGLAAKYGAPDLMEALIAAGCDVNHVNSEGLSPVECAIRSAFGESSEHKLSTLLDAGAARPDGSSMLCLAAYFAKPSAVALLLERGHDPNELCPVTKTTPLMSALTEPSTNSLSVARALLTAGADPNMAAPDAHNQKFKGLPINKLAIVQDREIEEGAVAAALESMIAAGLRIDHGDHTQYHPLTLCLRASNDAFARMLMEKGANPAYVNTLYRDGATSPNGKVDAAGNRQNHLSKSPFALFASSPMPRTVTYMIEHLGEDPEQICPDGTPVVQLAFDPPTRAAINSAIAQKRIASAVLQGAPDAPTRKRSGGSPAL
jgi:hypothetical protein